MFQRRSAAFLVSTTVFLVLSLQLPGATPWGGWKNIGSEISKGLSQAGREIESAASKVANEVNNLAHSLESAVVPANRVVEPAVDPEDLPSVLPTFVPRLPELLLGCPPLADPTLDIKCLKDGRVDCSQTMEKDTVARISCKSQYKLPEPYPGYTDISCTSDFTWSRPLFKCLPDCGKRNSPAKMSRGVQVPQLELPWTIGVYKSNQDGTYDQICSGSLIKANLVITAASCFWDKKSNTQSNFSAGNVKILAGSFDRRWPTSEQLAAAASADIPASIQTRDVKQVFIHERFLGRVRRLSYNIAIVRLNEPLTLTKSVNLVCMDWNPIIVQHSSQLNGFTAGNSGLVSSWGNAVTNSSSAFNIPVGIPYIPALSCSDKINDEVQDLLTSDKVCGGRTDEVNLEVNMEANMVVCPKDTGSGYVFPLDMVQGKRYFLRGVTSDPFHEEQDSIEHCSTQNVAIFTYLSAHSKWLVKNVFGQ